MSTVCAQNGPPTPPPNLPAPAATPTAAPTARELARAAALDPVLKVAGSRSEVEIVEGSRRCWSWGEKSRESMVLTRTYSMLKR